MAANKPHERRVGNIAKVYPGLCKYRDENGSMVFRDLTGATVTFSMVNAATGVLKVSAASANIVSASGGEVAYTFLAEDVDTAGIFWATFHVTVSGLTDSYPVAPDDGVIWIHSATQTAQQAYDAALVA
jgi:hypothetical protein